MDLIEKIKNKSANIGIIGLGYVGLPLGLEFANKGFNVLGFDVDENKIKYLMRGESYIKHIGSEKIKKTVYLEKINTTVKGVCILDEEVEYIIKKVNEFYGY